jgi:hypothetical protein
MMNVVRKRSVRERRGEERKDIPMTQASELERKAD